MVDDPQILEVVLYRLRAGDRCPGFQASVRRLLGGWNDPTFWRHVPGGVFIFGAIDPQHSDSLVEAIKARPGEMVFLDSGGGDAQASFEIADAVRAAGCSTHVLAYAYSGAALIALAGARRTVSPGGKLGFHGCQSYFWGGVEKLREAMRNSRRVTRAMAKRIKAALPQAGPNMLAEMTSDDLLIFDDQRALAYGLVHAVEVKECPEPPLTEDAITWILARELSHRNPSQAVKEFVTAV